MSFKVKCQFCSKKITCRSKYEIERHSQFCKGQNNNFNHDWYLDNINNNQDDMSITSSSKSNDSVLSLTNMLQSSVKEYNTDYSSDIDDVLSSTNCNDDIFSTTNDPNQQFTEEMSLDEDNISLPSILDILDLENVIDYSVLKLSDNNCDSSMLLHPFEAKLLQLFVNNSIPITLFQQFTKLFQYALESDYNPKLRWFVGTGTCGGIIIRIRMMSHCFNLI